MRLIHAPLMGAAFLASVSSEPYQVAPNTYHAAREGDMYSLRHLRQLDHSQHGPQQSDTWQKTALHYAAEYGHMDVAQMMVGAKADLSAHDYRGRTPLMLAASKGNIRVLNYLLSKCKEVDSCNIDDRDESGKNALHHAAEFGHSQVIKILTKGGIDQSTSTTEAGKTALMLAAERGHDMVLYRLVEAMDSHEKSAIINQQDSEGLTALLHAITRGHEDSMRFLIKNGADINGVDKGGRTALHHCIMSGQTQLAKLLLGKSYRLSAVAQDNKGETPIHYAARAGNDQAMMLLFGPVDAPIKNGIALDDNIGQTPLHVVCRLPAVGYAEIIEYNQPRSPHHYQTMLTILNIISKWDFHNNFMNLQDNYGHTALTRAVEYGDLRMIKTLRKKGAKFVTLNNGQSVFHLAIEKNRLNSLTYMLHAVPAAEREPVDDNNDTPLMFAVKSGNYGAVDMLLRYKANVNVRSKNRTPVMWAIIGSKYDIADLLFHHNADVSARGEMSLSLLHFAAGSGDNELVSLVLTWMKKTAERNDQSWGVENLHPKDKSNTTPMETAAYLNQPETVENLMARCIKLAVDFTTMGWRGNEFRNACSDESTSEGMVSMFQKSCRFANDQGNTDVLKVLGKCCPGAEDVGEAPAGDAENWAAEAPIEDTTTDGDTWESDSLSFGDDSDGGFDGGFGDMDLF